MSSQIGIFNPAIPHPKEEDCVYDSRPEGAGQTDINQVAAAAANLILNSPRSGQGAHQQAGNDLSVNAVVAIIAGPANQQQDNAAVQPNQGSFAAKHPFLCRILPKCIQNQFN